MSANMAIVKCTEISPTKEIPYFKQAFTLDPLRVQRHTKIYLKYFGYSIADTIACEYCGKPASEIHHLKPRSLCSDAEVNKISNLIALDRECHEKAHNSRDFNEDLKVIHRRNVNAVDVPVIKYL